MHVLGVAGILNCYCVTVDGVSVLQIYIKYKGTQYPLHCLSVQRYIFF